MSDTLGKLLSDRRLKQGLTVEEVSERTRINPKFIRAAEADQFERLPGLVFVKGFLRAYANVLGLDGNDMVARYEALKIEERDHSPKLISMPLYNKPALTGRMALFALFLAAVVAGWAYFYLSSEDSLPAFAPSITRNVEKSKTEKPVENMAGEQKAAPEAVESPAALQSKETAVKQPGKKEEELKQENAPAGQVSSAADTRPEDKPEETAEAAKKDDSAVDGISDTSRPFSLTVQAVSDTWIKAVIDEEVTREIILREGHTVTWWAERGYKLSIGNVAGTKVFLNNEEVQLNQPASNIIMNLVLPPPSARGREENIAERQ